MVRPPVRALIVAGIVFAIDRITKIWVVEALEQPFTLALRG